MNPTTTKPARTPEEQAQIDQFFGRLKAVRQERAALVVPAAEALNRLVMVCAGGTGQAYKLRALLFSVWNGKPVDLLVSVSLDWEVKKNFCQVVLAFGHDEFFYDAVKFAFEQRNLFAWFQEEGESK